MLKYHILRIILAFAVWRIVIFAVALGAIFIIPEFGNRFPYWDTILVPTGLPSWIWGFGNFDGVHYLRIATMGYESSQYSQAFFPLYPLFIKLVTISSGNYLTSLIFSNSIFLLVLIVFYKLIEIDFSKKIALYSTVLLIVFPTSFYFGSLYSESLFLFFTVSTLYLIRKKNYLVAGVYGLLACSTRILGLWLIPVYLIEIYMEYRNKNIEKYISSKIIVGLILIPLGFLLYILYLGFNFNDPLLFLNSQPAFGAERNSFPIILLPQVLFRYFKIIISTQIYSLPFFNTILELMFTLFPLLVSILAYKKIRFSYWIFTLGCLILPTLTGTLSSMPRYALMSFLLFPFIVQKFDKYFILITVICVALGIVLVSLFTRGYWVA